MSESNSTFQQIDSLLNSHLHDILNEGQGLSRAMTLYKTGDYWIAFEKSAYLLSRLSTHIPTSVLSLRSLPFPIIMAYITNSELSMLQAKISLVKNTSTHNVYNVTAPFRASIKQYGIWHSRECERG